MEHELPIWHRLFFDYVWKAGPASLTAPGIVLSHEVHHCIVSFRRYSVVYRCQKLVDGTGRQCILLSIDSPKGNKDLHHHQGAAYRSYPCSRGTCTR